MFITCSLRAHCNLFYIFYTVHNKWRMTKVDQNSLVSMFVAISTQQFHFWRGWLCMTCYMTCYHCFCHLLVSWVLISVSSGNYNNSLESTCALDANQIHHKLRHRQVACDQISLDIADLEWQICRLFLGHFAVQTVCDKMLIAEWVAFAGCV